MTRLPIYDGQRWVESVTYPLLPLLVRPAPGNWIGSHSLDGVGALVHTNFLFFFFFENVAFSVLSVAKCLLYTVMTFAIHKNKKDASMIK